MPKFAANLGMMFNEVPFPERMQAAADAGFRAVEYPFPYGYAAGELVQWNAQAGVEQVLINTPAGNSENGERGLACLPDRRDEFRDGIAQAIDYALALACPRIHVMAGLAPPPGAPERQACESCYRESLVFAADAMAPHYLTALIEPINTRRDMPGFFLASSGQARAILAELDRPNLKLQFDVYHVQVQEGDVARRLRDAIADIGHVQIANPPERHEPDDGEIYYPYLFDLLDELGYDGWVACEYRPRGDTRQGLSWGAAFDLKT